MRAKKQALRYIRELERHAWHALMTLCIIAQQVGSTSKASAPQSAVDAVTKPPQAEDTRSHYMKDMSRVRVS